MELMDKIMFGLLIFATIVILVPIIIVFGAMAWCIAFDFIFHVVLPH
jgi:hypothetical protein